MNFDLWSPKYNQFIGVRMDSTVLSKHTYTPELWSPLKFWLVFYYWLKSTWTAEVKLFSLSDFEVLSAFFHELLSTAGQTNPASEPGVSASSVQEAATDAVTSHLDAAVLLGHLRGPEHQDRQLAPGLHCYLWPLLAAEAQVLFKGRMKLLKRLCEPSDLLIGQASHSFSSFIMEPHVN